ncbi:hypothetical protein QPK87_04020 [Kamptonema cortianum]|nr:hypothetical protein [Kamptonema cortianum]MDL5048045.1 hypothetical protein [Oscillatoria amoena NRMC-F 0135]
MKLRIDLLEYLTEEDLLEQALANQHRYKAEPVFAKTGVGYLAPTSPEDMERDQKFSEELHKKLLARMEAKKKLMEESSGLPAAPSENHPAQEGDTSSTSKQP